MNVYLRGFCVFSALILWGSSSKAQLPDHVYHANIHSIKLTRAGDPYSYPIMNLNSSDGLFLVFDDLDGDVKSYYYTYQLCNADWTPANINTFSYIQGFQQTRINTYRNSSIASVRYTNYQAQVPDRSSTITRSGNYLLKVFLNGDTSRLAFTRRFLVVENKAAIGVQIQQPFNSALYNTHQKLRITLTTDNRVNNLNQQDIKVVALQNYVWDDAVMMNRPDIYRGNYFEYFDESKTAFPAGKEWRWLDMRSLRLMSERMLKMDKQKKITEVYVKPDIDRTGQAYIQYLDLNGLYSLETTDNVNPNWQTDYAYVHFTYRPPGGLPLQGRDLYIFGELTNYQTGKDEKMIYNEESGVYEVTLFLKQGYYNYRYITVNSAPARDQPAISYENTEGNYWGTENAYSILVYYRPFGGRADELIGYTVASSVVR